MNESLRIPSCARDAAIAILLRRYAPLTLPEILVILRTGE